MSHKKEAAGALLAMVIEFFSNQMIVDWGKALLFGGLGWVGAKLMELTWNWVVKKIKDAQAN